MTTYHPEAYRSLSALALALALALVTGCSSESSSTNSNAGDAAADGAVSASGGGANGAAGGGNGASGKGTGAAGKANGGAGGGGGAGNPNGGAGNPASGGSGNPAGGAATTGGASAAGGNSSGGVSSTGGASNTGGAPANGPKSAGCGKTGAKTGDLTLNLTVGTKARTFEVLVPASYNPNTPIPLTFVFHGLGGNSGVSKAFGLQDAASRAGGASLFVFPAGVVQGGDIGWDDSCNGGDVAFFDAMSKQLQDQYCIATNRVFVAGFSWGADITNSIGCCRGDKLRAIAPASGGLFAGPCTATGPAFRLTSGGTSDGYYTQADFTSGVTRARTSNHCTATQSPIAPSPCQAYQGCDTGKPVIWCSYPSMGHQMPDGWADATWAFFSGFQ